MYSGVARPTYDDVNLLLKLYDLRREGRLREARRWFAASFKVKTFEEFNGLCPGGSEPNASYRMVTGYWEMVASFLTSGVVNQELFFQSGRELLFTWERIRDVLRPEPPDRLSRVRSSQTGRSKCRQSAARGPSRDTVATGEVSALVEEN